MKFCPADAVDGAVTVSPPASDAVAEMTAVPDLVELDVAVTAAEFDDDDDDGAAAA